MSTIESREFKRSRILVNLLIVNALLSGLVGLLCLIGRTPIVGFLWFMASALWFINFLWSRRTPYIRITNDGIMLFPAMARSPRVIKWDTVQKIDCTGKKKLIMQLTTGKKVRISLYSINGKERESLIRVLQRDIEGRDRSDSKTSSDSQPKVFCECQRVYLRKIQLSDVPLIVKWKKDPLIKKMALSLDVEITAENQEQKVKKAIESDNELYLILVIKETDQPIGYIRINWQDNSHRFAWMGFALGEQRRKGYARDALRCLLPYLFNKGMHRVDAEVYEINHASLALLESLGFKQEGMKREAHFDGKKHIDVIALGLLKGDFKE